MKRIFFIALISLLAVDLFGAGRSQANVPEPGSWVSSAVIQNPGANSLVVTTGALNTRKSGGVYRFNLYFSATVTATFRIELLDGQSVVQKSFNRIVPANDSKLDSIPVSFAIPNGYSLRIMNVTGVVLGGTVQAAIIYEILEVM